MRKVLVLWAVAFLALGAGLAEAAILKAGNFACVATAEAPTPSEARLIFAGFWGDGVEPAAVLRSGDGGQTWTPVLAGMAASLAADPHQPGTIYAATAAGLQKSADYGATWSILNPDVKSWVAVNAGDSSVIYGDNLRSADGGTTWSAMSGLASFAAPYGGSFDRMPHIKVTAADPNFLIALAGYTAKISRDGGVSWSAIAGAERSDFYSVEVDPGDARNYYVGYCQYLQRWYPGGTMIYSTGGGDLYATTVDRGARARVFVSGQSWSLRSTNFGASWTQDAALPAGARTGRMISDRSFGMLFVPTQTGLHAVALPPCTDNDGDGITLPAANCGPADCNDADPTIFPGAVELCSDGKDNNCNAIVDCAEASCPGTPPCACTDADSDLFNRDGTLACGARDCDDANAATNPGASEVCNDGVDNNCNTKVDCSEAACLGTATCPCTDADQDGFATDGGNCGLVDCDDGKPALNPGAVDIALDGIDQDCNGYDLSIRITKATWSRGTGTLTVTATSGWTSAADLSLVTGSGTTPMSWIPPAKKAAGYWLASVTAPANPGSVTVVGWEGNAVQTVKTVR